jgi:hypothetical protein
MYAHPIFFKINALILHKIKDIQNFNTLYTMNFPLLTIHFMTNETYQNCTKFILMKIHKYTNILKVISLNYNHYNSCNQNFKIMGVKDFMRVHAILGSLYCEHTLMSTRQFFCNSCYMCLCGATLMACESWKVVFIE